MREDKRQSGPKDFILLEPGNIMQILPDFPALQIGGRKLVTKPDLHRMDAVPCQSWRDVIFTLLSVSHLLRASIDHGAKFRITLIFPRSDTCWGVPSPTPAAVTGHGDFLVSIKHCSFMNELLTSEKA